MRFVTIHLSTFVVQLSLSVTVFMNRSIVNSRRVIGCSLCRVGQLSLSFKASTEHSHSAIVANLHKSTRERLVPVLIRISCCGGPGATVAISSFLSDYGRVDGHRSRKSGVETWLAGKGGLREGVASRLLRFEPIGAGLLMYR
jgi:hypothetical protein